jgi:hypothetical protein
MTSFGLLDLNHDDFEVLGLGLDHLYEEAAVMCPRLTVDPTRFTEDLRMVFPFFDPKKLLPNVAGMTMRRDGVVDSDFQYTSPSTSTKIKKDPTSIELL